MNLCIEFRHIKTIINDNKHNKVHILYHSLTPFPLLNVAHVPVYVSIFNETIVYRTNQTH